MKISPSRLKNLIDKINEEAMGLKSMVDAVTPKKVGSDRIDISPSSIENRYFPEPVPITWKKLKLTYNECEEVIINAKTVAVLEKRPPYCDRGHWCVKCFLPTLDEADRFPRYYMDYEIAKQETEAFLKWRLWKGYDNASK